MVNATAQNLGHQEFSTTYNTVLPPGSLPPLASNVPAPPRHYVPRKELMESLRATLWGDGQAYVTGQAAASGDGGQGKTVLAQAYALESADQYPGGRFVVACESGSLTTGLAALLPVTEQTKGQTDAERAIIARTWLMRAARSLLILDNVVDDDQWSQPEFKALLPGPPCHVIATTRAEHLSGVKAVPVGRLSEAEALDLLDKFRPTAKDAQHLPAIRRILAEVESLAATVAAVGAVMQLDEDDDWEGYATHLANAPVDQLPDCADAVRREIGYAGKTMVVLDDLRRRLPPAELRVLDYAALLPADQLVPLWLERLLDADADESRGDTRLDLGRKPSGKPRAAADVLTHLRKLDLLNPAGGSAILLSLHRLHRRRASELLTAGPDLNNILLDAIIALAEARGKASQNAVVQPALRPELTPLSALVHTLADAGRTEAALSLANWIHTPLRGLARYQEGRHNLSRFVGPQVPLDPDTATAEHAAALSNLALILKDLGDLPAAQTRMERAIAIDEKHFDPDHPTRAIRYSNLAMILQALGDLPAARTRMEQAIAIDEKHFDPDHPTLAIRYSNLALILQNLKDLPAARTHMERAIAIGEKHFDPDHPTLAISYSNLALVLRDLGDLPAARTRMERAIAIGEKHFDPNHPTLATSYSNLATILRALGDLPAARTRMERAIAIDEMHFDPDHPTLATRCNNMAFIDAEAGEFGKALTWETRALEILRKHFDDGHPDVQTVSRAHTIFTSLAGLPPAEARQQFAKAMGRTG